MGSDAPYQAEARTQFENEVTGDMVERDRYKKSRKADTPESSYMQEGSGSIMMRSADHIQYDVIPQDTKN